MRARIRNAVLWLGHVQAQIWLGVFFWVILTPYSMVVRGCGLGKLPDGRWYPSEGEEIDLSRLRRPF